MVSRTADGLKSLLNTLQAGCRKLRLEISEKKSKVVAPGEDEWRVSDLDGTPVVTLKQVLFYKYLGVRTFGTMFKTAAEKQKVALGTAAKYKGATLKISKTGPDVVEVTGACWLQVAVPSILFGCETVPFTESNIVTLERIQSSVAKYALGLPRYSPNVVAQTEMGWRSVRHQLYRQQLSFYVRLNSLPTSRWAYQALMEHQTGGWHSSYLAYILRLRSEVGMLDFMPSKRVVQLHLDGHFLRVTNDVVSRLSQPALRPQRSWPGAGYVCESDEASTIAKIKVACAGLGNKAPRTGMPRRSYCPLCGPGVEINERHVIASCKGVLDVRRGSGVSGMLALFRAEGLEEEDSFYKYVNGLDSKRVKVTREAYLSRGSAMGEVVEAWLSRTK